MALCTLSFPGHITRASDPQKSASFSSQFSWGTDLLGQSQCKLNQVREEMTHYLCKIVLAKLGFCPLFSFCSSSCVLNWASLQLNQKEKKKKGWVLFPRMFLFSSFENFLGVILIYFIFLL